MFKHRTLFIVGAGASAEAGLPVGTQLADTISKKLDIRFADHGRTLTAGDADLFAQIAQSFRDEQSEYQLASWLIRDGIRLSNSIDDFLDVHNANERVQRVGKTAIVKAIFEAERGSKLYFNTSNPRNKLDMTESRGLGI